MLHWIGRIGLALIIAGWWVKHWLVEGPFRENQRNYPEEPDDGRED